MPLQQLPTVGLDDINHRRRSRETINKILTHQFDDSRVQTTAEVTAGVTPVNYAYPPNDIRRYLTAWTDGSDQTAGFQRAITVAYATSGELYLPDGLNILCSGVTLTMSGNRADQGFAIVGPGWNGAKITQTGSPGALITIVGATPTFNPSEAPLVLQGFSLQGVGKTADGILLDGVAYWRISGVQVRGCFVGLHLKSALLGIVNNNCMFNENAYGLYAERDGALPFPLGGSGCNGVTVAESIINLNTTFGIFIDSGDHWSLRDLRMEGNGTSLNVNTGGIRFGAHIAEDFGYADIGMQGLRMESNLGTNLLIDAPASGSTYFSLDNSELIDAGAHREIVVTNASNISIRNCISPGGGGDVWDITCSELYIENSIVTTLTDSSTTPTYVNVRTAAGLQASGRQEQVTLTLNGVSGTVTVSATCVQQGDDITLKIPTVSGVSTAITCTITGLSARYRPAATVFLQAPVTDNGITDVQLIDVSSGGTITLYKAGLSNGFTAAGTKGLAATVLKFKKS